ncbi:MAG TPA: CCA tRNA nucleotidyltransferase [Beutenbergiaceae bacterium]|nr:CCA tRNA nucleotidyltransferase [Beutenbergiaceae bacterium]
MSGPSSAAPAELLRTALGVIAEFAPQAIELGERFAAAGHELALVGGPVRDAFLGKASIDLDFATSALPEQTEQILSEWGHAIWDMGRDFGTIGARQGDAVVEVTTYRTEAYDPASRKPVVAYGDSLDGDLSRRDFTVNAMALRLPELVFVDPFGGLADLADGSLRTPAAPEQSFDDDPLRMMRAARFSAQLGFDVDPGAMRAISEMADRLQIVSAERVQGELVRLMLAPAPRRGLELMVYTGLADVILPELPGMQMTIDEHHRHKDVYEHSLTVLDQAIDLETGADGPVPGPDLVLRLAALLHDIGKPATRRMEPGGGVSFHHHEVVGAKMTTKRLRALRFDKATIAAVSKLVFLHLRFHGYGEASWSDSAVRRYVTDAGEELERLHRLTRADCTTRNKRKAARLAHAYDDLEQRIADLAEEEEIKAIRPDLDGTQIMQILDLKPGPVVGKAYQHLLGLRMEHGPMEPGEARAELLRWWDEHQSQEGS